MSLPLKKGTPVRVKELTGEMVASPYLPRVKMLSTYSRVSVTLANGRKFWCLVPTEMVEEVESGVDKAS